MPKQVHEYTTKQAADNAIVLLDNVLGYPRNNAAHFAESFPFEGKHYILANDVTIQHLGQPIEKTFSEI